MSAQDEKSNMRTPLGKVRGLGSAREGTEHFVQQRITAIANLALAGFVIWIFMRIDSASYAEARELLSSPPVAAGLILAIASAFRHMQLGMRVIIEDYVHSEGMKITLLIGNFFFCAALGVVAVLSILQLALGG